MPFQRRYDRATRAFIVDRTLTGPPRPVPSTGQAQTADGSIVSSAANTDIPPATPIKVSIPGINETVVDSRGVMSPRWWRFFEELYRRTGALEDNINSTELILGQSTTTVAVVITTATPTAEITHIRQVGLGIITATGAAPSILNGFQPTLGSLAMTGNVPTVVNA